MAGPGRRGEESKVLPQPAAGYWGYLQTTDAGILYLDRSQSPGAIRLYRPNRNNTAVVLRLLHAPPVYQGLAASRDGRILLLSGKRDAGRHITLVKTEAREE